MIHRKQMKTGSGKSQMITDHTVDLEFQTYQRRKWPTVLYQATNLPCIATNYINQPRRECDCCSGECKSFGISFGHPKTLSQSFKLKAQMQDTVENTFSTLALIPKSLQFFSNLCGRFEFNIVENAVLTEKTLHIGHIPGPTMCNIQESWKLRKGWRPKLTWIFASIGKWSWWWRWQWKRLW